MAETVPDRDNPPSSEIGNGSFRLATHCRSAVDRLLGVCNDVGLLSEEYDPVQKRLVGNFPQAFSHVALINCAHNLTLGGTGPAQRRASD